MLNGVQVLECGDARVEFAGRLFAQMDASVVKIEPLGGAASRDVGPFASGDDGSTHRSLHWETWNAGKRSVQYDLQSVGGRTITAKLVEQADIILVGYDVPEAWGVSADDVLSVDPTKIYVDVTPFGRSGPYAGYAGTDSVVFALSGYLNLSGRPGRAPVVAPGQQAYVVAGAQAALSAIIALRRKRLEGSGEAIEVSAFETLAAQENLYSSYAASNTVLERAGSQHRGCLPGRIYAVRDGFVHLFVGPQKERGVWDRWVQWTGNPVELADPRFNDMSYRRLPENHEMIDRLADDFFAKKTRDEAVAEGQDRHIPIVPVLTVDEVMIHPHIVERETFTSVSDGLRAPIPLPNPPWRSQVPPPKLSPAPRLGEHTEAALRECGISGVQLDELRATGVL